MSNGSTGNFLEEIGDYQYGFRDPDVSVYKLERA